MNPTHMALGGMVLILCLATVGYRYARFPAARGDGSGAFCVGVSTVDNADIWIVCSRTRKQIMRELSETAELPQCGRHPAPSRLRPGDHMVFAPQFRACSLVRVDRLSGALRLLCGARIDVNRDDLESLKFLPMIGPTKARRIIEHRMRNGPFKTIQNLTRVPGIGPKTAEGLKGWLEW